MPAYDYTCTGCKTLFEAFLSISKRNEPCEVPCPECGGKVELTLTRAPGLVATAYTNLNPPSGFKDLLNKMKKENPRSKIDV